MLETQPTVSVIGYGHSHHALNLQAAEGIRVFIEGRLMGHKGTNILYWELSSALKEEQAGIIVENSHTRGMRWALAFQFLGAQLNRFPTTEEVDTVVGEIANTEPNLLIDSYVGDDDLLHHNQLIPLEMLQTYFLATEFDQLNVDRQNFSYRIESHSSDKLRTLTNLNDQMQPLDEARFFRWENGEFDLLISERKKYYELLDSVVKIRSRDRVEDLANIAKGIFNSGGGISVALAGSTHLREVEIVQRRLGPVFRANYELMDTANPNTPEIVIARKKLLGERIPDLIYGQSCVVSLALEHLQRYLIPRGGLYLFTANYQDWQSRITSLAMDLSIEQIAGLCQKKVDLVEALELRNFLTS